MIIGGDDGDRGVLRRLDAFAGPAAVRACEGFQTAHHIVIDHHQQMVRRGGDAINGLALIGGEHDFDCGKVAGLDKFAHVKAEDRAGGIGLAALDGGPVFFNGEDQLAVKQGLRIGFTRQRHLHRLAGRAVGQVIIDAFKEARGLDGHHIGRAVRLFEAGGPDAHIVLGTGDDHLRLFDRRAAAPALDHEGIARLGSFSRIERRGDQKRVFVNPGG